VLALPTCPPLESSRKLTASSNLASTLAVTFPNVTIANRATCPLCHATITALLSYLLAGGLASGALAGGLLGAGHGVG